MKTTEKHVSQDTKQKQEKEDKQNSNYELMERTDIEDTPFTIITTEEGSFGVMGKFRITEKGTYTDVKKELEKITWNRVIQVTMLLWEQLNEKQINTK